MLDTTGSEGVGAAAPWEALMQAALAGDERAYDTLLRQMSSWLRAYFRRRLPPGLCEDAAQDALIAVHEKRHTWQPGKPLLPWVAAIARYKWIDRLRATRPHEELVEQDLPAADHTGPLGDLMLLEALLGTLKPAQSDAIRLVKLQGFSIAEASRMTGQSESLVKINIHRGVARLARQVERMDPDTDLRADAGVAGQPAPSR